MKDGHASALFVSAVLRTLDKTNEYHHDVNLSFYVKCHLEPRAPCTLFRKLSGSFGVAS
jgi:hypothetical protein